jgi:hypothetical protein
VPGIRDLKDAALRVVGQKDLAIAIRIISAVLFSCYVPIRNENHKASIRCHIPHD